MLLKREQLVFLAAVLIGAYGIDRGLTALVWLAAAYYATRYDTGARANALGLTDCARVDSRLHDDARRY